MSGRDGEYRRLTEEEVARLLATAELAVEARGDGLTLAEVTESKGGLDRWLDRLEPNALDSRSELLESTAILLGARMCSALDLEWVAVTKGGDWAVRKPGTSVVFFPRRMLGSQLAQRTEASPAAPPAPLRLDWLIDSTRDYLKNLLRFHPSQCEVDRRR